MLRLRTLGVLSVEDAHGATGVLVAQRARLALLARLATDANGGVSREQLQALFWPESDTARARGALNQALYILRRELGVPDLVLGTTELRLNPDAIRSDVGEFMMALGVGENERAVACYGGQFLAGVHLRNGEFERWRDAEAERLARQHRDALHDLATAADARGDGAASLRWWGTLRSVDALSARATIGVMRSLAGAGEIPAAVQHGRVYERLVLEELGSPPDGDVTRLIAQLSASPSDQRVLSRPPEPTRSPLEIARSMPDSTPPAFQATSSPVVAPQSATRRRRSARRYIAAAAGLTTLVAVVAFFAPSDDDALRLDIDAGIGGPATPAIRVAIEAKVLASMSGVHLAHAWPDRARLVATATVRTVGDSLHVTARLLDRSTGNVTAIPAMGGLAATPDATVQALSDGMAALVVGARAPLIRRWAAHAALPSNTAALRAVEEALSVWRPPDVSAARPHLERAASLDPASGTPIVLLALALAKAKEHAASDSILDQLVASPRRQGQWDRAMVAVVRAWNRGDLSTAHTAGHRLMEIAPASEWVIIPAYDALGVGRAREALALLDALPSNVAWTLHWQNVVRMQALMLAGEHDAALAEANRGLLAEPESRFHEQSAVKALAALGRVAEVEAICVRSLRERFNEQPCDQAARELRSWGHADAARRVTARYLAALKATDSLDAHAIMLESAWGAVSAADWPTVRDAVENLERSESAADDLAQLRVYAAASTSDSTRVRRLLAADSSLSLIQRASLLALAGDDEAAVAAIAAALRAGYRLGFSIRIWPGFERIRGYAPFESLIGPVDDPAHRRRVTGRRGVTAPWRATRVVALLPR